VIRALPSEIIAPAEAEAKAKELEGDHPHRLRS
jgi:hypothetical protein